MLALTIALVFVPLPPALIVLPLVVVILAWVMIIVRAARAASRAPQPYTLRPYNRWYWYTIAILFSLFVWQPVLVSSIKSRWVEAFRIPSTSMEPTVLAGDFMFVSKRPVGRPHRDDLVVYESPRFPAPWCSSESSASPVIRWRCETASSGETAWQSPNRLPS